MRRALLLSALIACCGANAAVTIERITVDDAAPPAPEQQHGLTVLTAWYPLYCIAAELTADLEDIEVHWSRETTAAAAVVPDAVLTFGAWKGEQAFQQARTANIHVVEIDATGTRTGATPALATLPQDTDAPLPPLYWLSTENLVKMVTLVAGDLARLSPNSQHHIEARRQRMVNDLNQLSREIGTAVASLATVEVTDPSGRLGHFVHSLGLVSLSPGAPGAKTIPVGEGGIDPLLEPGENNGWTGLMSRLRNNLTVVQALFR